MNGTLFSPEDLRVLRRLYPHNPSAWIAGQLGRTVNSINGQADRYGLKKDPAYKALAWRQCGLNAKDAGRAYQFKKGQVPANKGTRRPGWAPGRMRETQFRKGNVNGMAKRLLQPIGATRLIDGYLYVKFAAVPNVAYTVNWKPVHILEWERENGRPVPPGHIVSFRDRDRTHITIENLELITMADNVRRNSLHNLPAPLVEVIQLRGAIQRRITMKERCEQKHP